MKTRLERLLENLDPIQTLDKFSARTDKALNSFQIDSGIINNWGQFKAVLTRFHWHLQRIVLNASLSSSPGPEVEWGFCCQKLQREYGENGEKAAFELARSGAEGGLYSVLRAIARQLITEYAENDISTKIYQFWEQASPSEILAAADEYLQQFGHLLPPELTEGIAIRIRANFLKALREHPRLIQRLREIGREP